MGVLFLVQLAAALAALAFLWRRLQDTRAELEDLRQRMQALEDERIVRRRTKRAAPAAEELVESAPIGPHARAARAWSGTARLARRQGPPPISDEFRIGGALGLSAIAPAFAFVFGVGGVGFIAAGILMAAVMMALALRPAWAAGAWTAAATGAVWAAIGFATGDAQAHTALFAAALAVSGVSGCAYAYVRRLDAGGLLAAAMAASSLFLAAQTGMVGPAGAAFASIALAAALTGASSLRLEGLLVAAFLATLVGLFVLSGQSSAAIWFTPAAGLAGAVFFAIAMVRVPKLGSRGFTLAGAGALAPLTMVATLSAAQHGLADRFAVGSAFLLVSLALAGLLALTAGRRGDRLEGLGPTLWVLALASAAALAAAVLTAAPLPLAAPAFGAFALLATALDQKFKHAVWRSLAIAFALGAATLAAANAQQMLAETTPFPAPVTLMTALGLTPLLLGFSGWLMRKVGAPGVGGLFVFLAGAVALVAANLIVRLAFSSGAVRLHPMSFVEAGAHIAVWLAAALVIVACGGRRSSPVLTGASAALIAAALAATAMGGLMWFTPYWNVRPGPGAAWPGLGFILPALLFGAHWAYMRGLGSRGRTRMAFAGCVVALAAAVALALVRLDNVPQWLTALSAAAAMGIAIALNFAPGVTAKDVLRASRAQPPQHA